MPPIPESRCIHSPANVDLRGPSPTTLVRLLTLCCSFVGGTIVATPSSSWIAKHNVHWNLLDPGCASDAFLGPPFLCRVGQVPMRDGWTVKGRAFGLFITGAVSVPVDAHSALFVCTTKLDTGPICHGTRAPNQSLECIDTVLLCRGTPLDEPYITGCRSHSAQESACRKESACRRNTQGLCREAC